MFKGFIGTFKAAYGREGLIWVDKNTCDLCDKEAFCINIDSSEGEYGQGSVCRGCVDKIFWSERSKRLKDGDDLEEYCLT